MQHENQNKKKEWILRLESVEQPLNDAGIAWDRLHARLGKKKKNKAVAWYWAAAAIVIIIAGTLLMPAAKTKEPVVVKDAQTKPPPVVIYQALVADPLATKQKNINNRKEKIKAPVVKMQEQLITAAPPSETISPATDTVAAIAAAPTPVTAKKKLRVVHINQLDNYIEQKATRDYFTTTPKMASSK
jgi:hypothetical protein